VAPYFFALPFSQTFVLFKLEVRCHPLRIFTSIELVKELMEKTHTKTGLSVVINVLDKVYKTGRKVAEGFKETIKIIFDEYLPKWNYRAVPTIE